MPDGDGASSVLAHPSAPADAGASAATAPVPVARPEPSVADRLLGRSATRAAAAVDGFGSVSAMVLDSIVATANSLRRGQFPWREFFDQAWMMVSVSLLPTILISVPFGTIIVLEVGGLAHQIGSTSIVGSVDAIFAVREVAPVVTALILSGAAGSAICADLGSRTIRDEIAAMEVMGVNPLQRLVAPRLLAGLVVAVLLNGIVAFAGIVSAYATAIYVLHGTAGSYLSAFSAFSQPADIIESMLKAGVFGLVGTVLACYKGLTTSKGAVGVGRAVNQAVVVGGVALFFLNLVLTEIFLVLVPVKVP